MSIKLLIRLKKKSSKEDETFFLYVGREGGREGSKRVPDKHCWDCLTDKSFRFIFFFRSCPELVSRVQVQANVC